MGILVCMPTVCGDGIGGGCRGTEGGVGEWVKAGEGKGWAAGWGEGPVWGGAVEGRAGVEGRGRARGGEGGEPGVKVGQREELALDVAARGVGPV